MDASFNPNAVEAQTNQGDDLGGIGSAFLDAASQQSDNTGLGVRAGLFNLLRQFNRCQ